MQAAPPLWDRAHDIVLTIGCWSVLLCLFSVPINKPATTAFIVLALLCSLLGARVQERWQAAIKQPVVIGALLWLLVLAISALYAPPGTEQWKSLRSALPLLYPLIVASLMETPQWRIRGMQAFGLAVSLVLLISWCQFFGVVPERAIAGYNPAFHYTVFKDYTQQGIEFIVLAAMAASFAQTESRRNRKILLWIVAAFATINVVFLLQSRTSYLIVAPLLALWAWHLVGGRRANWRGILLGVSLIALCAGAALLTPRVQQRMEQSEQDVTNYSNNRQATSLGIRFELWKRTVPIIASAPVFGHGLGQWDPQFQAEVKDFANYGEFRMHHPHQEAMLILSEQGIVGLAIFIALLIFLGRYIRRLPAPQHNFYASLFLIYVTGSLANCLLADFSHRHVFIMLLACMPFIAKPNSSTSPAIATS
jgi:O-antigen ligase